MVSLEFITAPNRFVFVLQTTRGFGQERQSPLSVIDAFRASRGHRLLLELRLPPDGVKGKVYLAAATLQGSEPLPIAWPPGPRANAS